MYAGNEERLRELRELSVSRRSDSPTDAMVALFEATRIVNEEIGDLSAAAMRSADVRERLKRWVDALADIALKVAEQSHALTYTISVGLPAGVSVGLTWQAGE
jgi:hypothetical protein